MVRPPPLPSKPAAASMLRAQAPMTIPRQVDPPLRRQPREEAKSPSSPAEEEDYLGSKCPSALLLTGILERLQQVEEKVQKVTKLAHWLTGPGQEQYILG